MSSYLTALHDQNSWTLFAKARCVTPGPNGAKGPNAHKRGKCGCRAKNGGIGKSVPTNYFVPAPPPLLSGRITSWDQVAQPATRRDQPISTTPSYASFLK